MLTGVKQAQSPSKLTQLCLWADSECSSQVASSADHCAASSRAIDGNEAASTSKMLDCVECTVPCTWCPKCAIPCQAPYKWLKVTLNKSAIAKRLEWKLVRGMLSSYHICQARTEGPGLWFGPEPLKIYK